MHYSRMWFAGLAVNHFFSPKTCWLTGVILVEHLIKAPYPGPAGSVLVQELLPALTNSLGTFL